MTSAVARLTSAEAAAVGVVSKVGLPDPMAKNAWMKPLTALSAGKATTPALAVVVNDEIAATVKAVIAKVATARAVTETAATETAATEIVVLARALTAKVATAKVATAKVVTAKVVIARAVTAVAGVVAVKAAGQTVAIRLRPRAILHALA
jgi:hypothetical protein